MATVKAIKYGMKGDDVSNLQTSLKNAGYNLDIDGNFGPQTLAAVKDYQQKNGLDVDGMVGPQTSAVLFGGNTGSTPTSTTPAAGKASGGTSGKNVGSGSAASAATKVNYPDNFSYDSFSYGDYQESETVTQAQAALEAALASQPGAYQSKWQGQIDEIIGRILNREAFNYDFNEDALYKQYAEQYMRGGKLAMQDTMGQAAAMTGGYGNSYASTAGNQAYQEYLSQLNAVIPELYGMALDRYQMEGQEMYNQYGLLSDREAQDYGRYQDEYNKWLTERDYATGRYDSERDYDHSKYIDDRNFEYGTYADDRNQAYSEYLDAVQQAQWGAQFDEGIREYEENMAFNREQADISNSQWEQSFNENKRQNEIANEQWETSRLDKIDSENRAYAREDVMAVIQSGGTPTTVQLAAAGMSRKTAEAMAAISSGSGNSDDVIDLVGKMSTSDIVDMLESYASDGDDAAIDIIVDDLYLTGRITEDQWQDMKNKYKSGNAATDTTVATKPTYTGGGGGKIMVKY
jgi:hypothetical protein